MPPPVDLTGRRFGALLALRSTRYKTGERGWVCLCDCGRETVVPTRSLSGVPDGNPRAIRACETCRSRACVVCGDLYLTAGSAKTCGRMECRLEHRRAVNRAAAARTELRNPGEKTERQRRYIAHMREADPARYLARLEADRMAQRRYRASLTPEQRAQRRAAQRDYYARNRERIRAYVRQWLADMPPAQRARWDAAMAASAAESRRRRALALMMRQAAELMQRMEPPND